MSLPILTERRSVRQYQKSKPVPKNVVQSILDIAVLSPTGKNIEGLDIVALNNYDKLKTIFDGLYESYPPQIQGFLNERKTSLKVDSPATGDAPLVFFIYKNERYEDHLGQIDAGILTLAIVAAARSQGLETLILGVVQAGNKSEIEKAIAIPENSLIIGVAAGYPVDNLSLPAKVVRTKTKIIE
jgi:nitroreductase